MSRNLIIKNETELEIEVANGFIYIDSQDVELNKKIDNLYNTFEKGHKEFLAKDIIINKEQNEKVRNEKKIDATIDFIDSVYKAINELFGKGASQKIFRNKTIAGLETFLEALPPLLEDLKITTENYFDKRTTQEVKEKYAPISEQEDDILEVE